MDIGVNATSTHLDFISGYRGSADMQWNTMPTQLRREFDNVGSMGELVGSARRVSAPRAPSTGAITFSDSLYARARG